MEKTMVMKILEQKKIPYQAHYYEPIQLDAVFVANTLGQDVNRVFKDNSFQMWGCKPKVIGEDVTIHNKQKFNNKLKKYVEIMNKENIDRINYKK